MMPRMVRLRGLRWYNASRSPRSFVCGGTASPFNAPSSRSMMEDAAAAIAAGRPAAPVSAVSVRSSCSSNQRRRAGPVLRAWSSDVASLISLEHPQDSRGTNKVGASCCPSGTSRPASLSSRSCAANLPSRPKSWRMLDSAGLTKVAASTSSNPTTAWSRGSSRPAAVSADMTPIAFRSVATMTAVDRSPSASMAWPARRPNSSSLSAVEKTSVGSGSMPASIRAST